jgi:hypothetical protein
MSIYSPVSYQMGADEMTVDAVPTAPVTKEAAARSKASLKSMKASLKSWLSYRKKISLLAEGRGADISTPLLKRPGARPPHPSALASGLRERRYAVEQPLALELYALLSEVFDPAQLPAPDVAKDPLAAVNLAKIAIGGQLPGDAPVQQATGIIWMWPLVIVVGGVAFVISSSIRSKADIAKNQAKIDCQMAGKCTDEGFWLKIGALAVIGVIVWDKMGVGERVKGMLKGKKKR